jgi:hypothetical protein
MEGHRDVDQAETDRPGPDRVWHHLSFVFRPTGFKYSLRVINENQTGSADEAIHSFNKLNPTPLPLYYSQASRQVLD